MRAEIVVHATFLLAAALLTACSSVTSITITSEPTGAMIQVDKNNLGETPISTRLDFSQNKQYIVAAMKAGYFPEERVLNERSDPVRVGTLRIVLAEDEAWKVTATSEATNNWLRIQVDSRLAETDVWQKLVDSVTSRYTSLEQLDNSSGYMRTIHQIRRFRGPRGEFRVRTRFLCAIASKTPLVYKFRIEAEASDPRGDWLPYARVFKEDAALIEELQNRLGIK